MVVDIWGGMADPASGHEWRRIPSRWFFPRPGPDSDLYTPASRRPENWTRSTYSPLLAGLGCNGKEHISTRMVLTHRAGLAAVDGELTLPEVLAWEPVVADRGPGTQLGARSKHGYHARSFGWILGELIRLITRQSAGQYLAGHICQPLGLRYWVGLPADYLPACATLLPPVGAERFGRALLRRQPDGPGHDRAQTACSATTTCGIGPRCYRGGNAVFQWCGDARSLARFYAALTGQVEGVQMGSGSAGKSL